MVYFRGPPRDFDDWHYLTQLNQARALVLTGPDDIRARILAGDALAILEGLVPIGLDRGARRHPRPILKPAPVGLEGGAIDGQAKRAMHQNNRPPSGTAVLGPIPIPLGFKVPFTSTQVTRPPRPGTPPGPSR